jgi:hypothetical protein
MRMLAPRHDKEGFMGSAQSNEHGGTLYVDSSTVMGQSITVLSDNEGKISILII